MNDQNPIIEIHQVKKNYVMGNTIVHALRGIDVTIYPGEMVAIMGPSGSGKTTFMNTLGCLDKPSGGEYILNGQKVASLTEDELATIRNKYIGFVFQNFHLLPRESALKNVELPMIYAGVKNRHERAVKALEQMGLGQRLNNKPAEMSGGQMQRVAIARAIVNDPVLLLADEPTGNLDSRTSEEIMAIFQDLNRQGRTIVIVTHEEDIAQHCKRIIRFKDGNIRNDEQVKDPVDARDIIKTLPNMDELDAEPPVPVS